MRHDDGTATFELGYRRRFGARLRAVRHLQGLRLHDVEERSGGRVGAGPLASYERGDRAVTTPELSALAGVYALPVDDLLPDDDSWPPPGGMAPLGGVAPLGVQLSVPALHACPDPLLAPLQQLVRHVRVLRRDLDGQVLTLREDDLRDVAEQMDLDLVELPAWLAERRLLAVG